eukprot:scpid102447/ scgid19708/ 
MRPMAKSLDEASWIGDVWSPALVLHRPVAASHCKQGDAHALQSALCAPQRLKPLLLVAMSNGPGPQLPPPVLGTDAARTFQVLTFLAWFRWIKGCKPKNGQGSFKHHRLSLARKSDLARTWPWDSYSWECTPDQSSRRQRGHKSPASAVGRRSSCLPKMPSISSLTDAMETIMATNTSPKSHESSRVRST